MGFVDAFRKLWGWLSGGVAEPVYARRGTWAVPSRGADWVDNSADRAGTWAVASRTADWLYPPLAP